MPSLKRYAFRYNYDGQSWAFEIPAHTAAEARERLSRIAFASYEGEIVATIPVPIPTGPVSVLRSLGRRVSRFLGA